MISKRDISKICCSTPSDSLHWFSSKSKGATFFNQSKKDPICNFLLDSFKWYTNVGILLSSSFYEFLHVCDMPHIHWTYGLDRLMAEHIYSFIKDKYKSMIQDESFLTLTIDESMSIDNTSY